MMTKKNEILKVKEPKKLRQAIIDALGKEPKDVTIEINSPKVLDPENPWSGNIYRYSF